jgi:branched-chain amino acid aminotransferase
VKAYINFDGKVLCSDEKVLTADNRSFRYGDGLFETLKLVEGRLLLAPYHFERLFAGLRTLQFDPPAWWTAEHLSTEIINLCKKNGHSDLARARLVVFRGNGGLSEPVSAHPHYIIESGPLDPKSGELNSEGLLVDLFPGGRKSCDALSNLKSNNYLVYALAAIHARQRGLNDCLVLNSREGIADSTIANLFCCRQQVLYTPPLSEGCVAGVMRRHLLESLPKKGFTVREEALRPEDLESADEIFLCNALRGIRWVGSFRGYNYGSRLVGEIHAACMGERVE